MSELGLVNRTNVGAAARSRDAAARTGLVMSAALAAAVGGASAAWADDQPPAPQVAAQPPQQPLEEVMVTGSRVIREGMSSPTPVTSVSTQDLIAINPGSVVQALSTLPELSASTTPKSIGGSTSAGAGSFLNLRNLGPTRDLVLLDGRRLVPNNLAGNVDVNQIPQELISNVSIVTGGASAAYGSDAVAGVTNFILDTRFTGLKLDVSDGISEHDDGGAWKASVAWGAKLMDDDRLHLIASFDWRRTQTAYSANRDWSNDHCAIIPIPGVTTANESASNPRQTFACNVTQPFASYGGAIVAGPLTTAAHGISFGPGGIPQNFNYGQLKTTNFQVGGTGSPAYYGDVVNFTPGIDNKVGFAHLNYDVSDSLQAWAQVTASRNNSTYDQTPPNFNGTRPFNIFSGNAFLPAAIQAQMTQLGVASVQYNIVPKDWGNLSADESYETYDALAGLKGKFGSSWNWDAHFEHGRTQWKLKINNEPNLPNLYRAVDAVTAPNGTVACASTLTNPAQNSGCVPINLFGQGAASPQALAYVLGQLWQDNVMIQDDVSGSLNGEPFSTWAGAVSVAGGAEWRRLQGIGTSDPISQNYGDYTGVRGVPAGVVSQDGGWMASNPKAASGTQSVKEGFVEILVPLAKDLPFARSLDLNGAGRVTDYSLSGTVETWKVGLTWRPIEDLLLRATESRDIRAPDLGDLFAGDATAPSTVQDPTRGGQTVTIKSANLGNRNLVPERANTTTYGLTYEPSWVRGFGLTLDYYDIQISDKLGTQTVQQTVNLCFQGVQEYCQQVFRDSTGAIFLVQTPTLNLNKARTRGLDFELYYHTALPWGATSGVRLIGNRLFESSTTVPGVAGPVYIDRVGDMGLGNPKWQVNTLLNYEQGPFDLDLNGRFISGGLFNTTYLPGDLDVSDQHVPSNFTLNAGIRYRPSTKWGAPEFYFNVTNVFDKAPPLIPGTALTSFQTNSALYDTMGRYFTLGVRAKL